MGYLFVFCVELFTLFLFSRFVTQAISSFFYRVSRKEHIAVGLLAFLFFPGTLIHELSHFFMAILCFVKVGEIEFVPQIRERSVKLGSVAIARTDPFRRALIGLAPLFVGLTCIFTGVYYLSAFPFSPWYVNILLLLFVVFEIGNTMFSSSRDVEGLLSLLIAIMFFIVVGYSVGLRVPESIISYISSEKTVMFLQQVCWYMLVPLLIDGSILFLSKLRK